MKSASRDLSRLRLVESVPRELDASRSNDACPSTPAPTVQLPYGRTKAGTSSDPVAVVQELSDAQLVALGLVRDAKALELLYRRHVSFAILLATRIEGAARDVEDVVHDAFLQAFEHLHDLHDPSLFRAWLGSIVVRAVRSRMRRTRLMTVLGLRSPEPVDLDAIASDEASPVARAQLAQIYALLQTIPLDDRIAWTLRCVEGHDLDTVAEYTNCSLATAKRRIGRAQQFLDGFFVDPQRKESSA